MIAGETCAPTVLIIGAGPTGLTLACELARQGIAFRLFDAASGPQPGSRGKGLQPRSLEVFDDLGIVNRIVADGRMAMPIRSNSPAGAAAPSESIAPAARPDIPYPASLITPQWKIEEALRQRLSALGGTVEFGMALASCDQSGDGVTAVLVGEKQAWVVHARWLVGCDGGHSLVRKAAGIAFEGETREEVRMIVADAEVSGLDRDAWHLWRHAEGFVGLCPLPSTSVFQYQASIAPGQDPELSLSNMRQILARRSGRPDIGLHAPAWSSLWRANIRLADRYRQGAVFVAGDAAHIHAPAGGLGMNTGIQDAYNLGWKLAAVAKGASPALLDTYQAERRSVAADVLALSNRRLQQAIEQKNIVTGRDASTSQLGISYRGSVLACDDREGHVGLRAGDRAPDATRLMTVSGERRLFDLTRGSHFTLLCFGDAHVVDVAGFELRTFRIVVSPVGPNDVADTAHHLRRAYDAADRTLVLIRPDGYIALISDAGDRSRICSYFAALAYADPRLSSSWGQAGRWAVTNR